MKIAIDVSPISGKQQGHKVRGVGFYLTYLKRALVEFHPEIEFVFFTQGEKLDKNVDLVHYPYFEPFFVTLPIIKSQKRVITVHDLTPLVFPKHFPAGIKGNISWQIQRFNLQTSDAIIADSVASQRDIRRIVGLGEEKVSVAYLAAADEFTRLNSNETRIREIKQKYNLPKEFVLYVGDVTWNKNVPRLIEAVKEIDVPLVMVGKALVEKNFDPTNVWNHDLVKAHALIDKDDNKIIRLGFIPTEDVVALFNSATVFAFPSIYEGFGLPVLEAMQSGCPVVTSKGGSLAEVAGNSAEFVDCYDIKSIAHGIKKVFSDDKLQDDLRKKGLDQAKKFSWEKTARDTIEVYKQVIAKP